MRVAYIVVVHRGPAQVGRLVRRLATDDASFVLHVDRRAAPDLGRAIARETAGLPVDFLERNRCYWGGFGMVRATLKGLGHLVTGNARFDYAVLLSGQDYPLRRAHEIEAFLEAADGKSYMNFFPLPRVDGWGTRGGLDRIEDWHLVGPRAIHLRLARPRQLPAGLEPYGGSAWWCLARPVVELIHHYVTRHPEVTRFFERSLHPSELFFQTVVMNSDLAHAVVDDSLRYVRWAGGDRSPVTLTAADADALSASDALFARKFDVGVDSRILDLIDSRLDQELIER